MQKSKALQNGEIVQLQGALVEVHDLIYFRLSQRARLDCILNQQGFGRIAPVASDVDTTNVRYNNANGRSDAPQFRNPLKEIVAVNPKSAKSIVLLDPSMSYQ